MNRARPTPNACWDMMQATAKAQREAGQPAPLFKAVHNAIDTLIGAKLLTILAVLPDRSVERLYTNDPVNYPLLGRKPANETAWSRTVISGKRSYLGRTYEDIKSVFYDHELIRSLGCESVINLAVVNDDRVVGLVNILHGANYYDEADVAVGEPFAQLLAPAFLSIR